MRQKLSKEEQIKLKEVWDKRDKIIKEIQELLFEGECSLLWQLSNTLLRTVLESQTSGLFDCMGLNKLFTLYRDAYRSENTESCETCFFGCMGVCEVNPGGHTPIRDFQGACRYYRREDNFGD